MFISACGDILLDLAEDPWIRRCRAADHHCITARLAYHADRVFGGDDVAVSDHGNAMDSGFRFGDTRPIRLAAVALFTRARVECDRLHAAVLSQFRHLSRDELPIVPTGAKFQRKWNGDGRAHLAQDLLYQR